MGCDYYIITYLVVRYTGGDEVEEYIQYDRLGMYYSFLYDRDIDDYDDLAKQELMDTLKIYQRQDKILYERGEWLIRDSAVQSYIDVLYSKGVSMDSVVSIEKKYECAER
jgi:hypothetical protein